MGGKRPWDRAGSAQTKVAPRARKSFQKTLFPTTTMEIALLHSYPVDSEKGGKIDKARAAVVELRALELLALLGMARHPPNSPTREELRSLFDWFHRERCVSKYFLHAMICSPPGNSAMERLQAHVLAATLREFRENRRRSTAIKACRVVRQLNIGDGDEYRELGEVLLDMPPGDSQSLLEWLGKRRAQLEAAGLAHSRYVLDGVAHLVNLFERYVHNRVLTQDREVKPVRRTSVVASMEELESGEPRSGGASRHDFYDVRTGREQDVECGASYLDFTPSGTVSHTRSRTIQTYRARAATDQIVRDGMLSPSRWGVLSPYAFTRLVQELRAGIKENRPEDALIAIALFTGRTIGRLTHIRLVDHSRAPVTSLDEDILVHVSARDGARHLALRSGLTLSAPDDPLDRYRGGGKGGGQGPLPRFALEETYALSSETIHMPLPAEIFACLNKAGGAHAMEEDVEARIAELRGDIPLLTAARISFAGRLWMYQDGAERSVIDRLVGAALAHAVPLYYENMSVERIMETYDRWVGHINQQISATRFSVSRRLSSRRVGSRRTPRLEVVRDLVRDYREFVVGRLRHGRSVLEAHNHYVMYTYLCLMLGTGMRPVRQAFESFADFCPRTKTYFILDKDSRRVAAPRHVPVPYFAAKQLEYYSCYLLELRAHLAGDEGSRKYIDAVMRGQAPYLFVFRLHGTRGKPEPLRPANVAATLGGHFPLVDNWNRHLLRTELVDRGVCDEVIQALMGHGEMGREPLARYSALAIADLEEARRAVEALGQAVGMEPLASRPAWERQDGLGARAPVVFSQATRARSGDAFALVARSKERADRRRIEQREETVKGVEWSKRVAEEAGAMTGSLRDRGFAEAWLSETTRRLSDELESEQAWKVARDRLSRDINRLNAEHGLEIPVPPAPKRFRGPPGIRDEVMFRAMPTVQLAADGFCRALAATRGFQGASKELLLPLVLFSAACFGGLVDPEQLLAFARALQRGQTRLVYCTMRRGLCWVEFHYKTLRRNNVLVDGEPRRMRRFFPDCTTLLLLLVLARERSRRATTGYKDGVTLMKHLRLALRSVCEVDVPARLTLEQFARGAITVAERQPGVALPNYIAEFACGVIDSVSLPDPYWRHYLGAGEEPSSSAFEPSAVGGQEVLGADGGGDSRPDLGIEKVKAVFSGLPSELKRRHRGEMVRRLDALIAEAPPLTLELLAGWLGSLLGERRLAPNTARRYSDWIAVGWLVQFDGVELGSLTSEMWHERYSALLEQVPERQRKSAAGRLDDFHYFMHRTRGYPDLPGDLHRVYRNASMVRARVIPEATFQKFLRTLRTSKLEATQKESFEWIFVLCYRLGTRIGETTRVLLSDIEAGDDPVVRLRANRFGNTKTRSPHQLRLGVFLEEDELQGFLKWLGRRRRIATGTRDLVFAPPNTVSVTWSTRDLSILFMRLMQHVSGLHFSPHDCRHSAATRLLWVAERMPAPDVAGDRNRWPEERRMAVFTANRSGRDRAHQLCAVFNHASPKTTFGDYSHLMDLILHVHLRRSRRRVPVAAAASAIGCPQKVLLEGGHCEDGNILVEKILPTAWEHNRTLFEVVEVAAGEMDTEKVDLEPPVEAHPAPVARDLVAPAQRVLEEIEGGQGPQVVAIRHGIEYERVKGWQATAERLAGITTRKGASRLFSRKRLRATRSPLAPTRLRDTADQRLASELIRVLREGYPPNRDQLVSACRYWLARATTRDAAIRFHSPEELRRFLECFVEARVVPNRRWLIEVAPPAARSADELIASWTVFPKVSVRILGRAVRKRGKFQHGIASLYLQKAPSPRAAGSRDTSSVPRYVLHMLSILLDVGGE